MKFGRQSFFPIGQRSFTSPASVMQPFKTQLNGQTMINPYGNSYNLIININFLVFSSDFI